MKHLQDTPRLICNPEDTNYCAYVDTDSNYFHAEPLLRHRYSNFDEMSDKEKDNALEKVALEYQDIITDYYDILAKEAFNVHKFPWFKDREREHWFEMKTECVIRSAYFRKTRRYAQWITKQEGIENEILDIKGLEFKKANFPPTLGEFFRNALIDVLKGASKEEIDERINKYKIKILNGSIPLVELGNPTAIKQLNKHQGPPAKVGEIFSKLKNVINEKGGNKVGAPASVKAAIIYNDLLRFWRLDGKHSYISQGDKVKWVYLKPNRFQIEAIAFLPFDIPKKILTFIEEHIDRQKVFDSILLNKLENFYSDLGWSLKLNSYKEKFFI